MKMPSESAFAKMLLKKRKANSSLSFLYRNSLKLIILDICVCILGGVILLFFNQIMVAVLFVGIFVGAFARGLGFFLSMKKGWPFTEKVIDWKKVEELAEITDDKT
ncbi:MAG: hypothetical protein K9M75_02900 [Phycisphaerae bacterium]|nr:hypothetical protein [Phycisphaerae bacterium]